MTFEEIINNHNDQLMNIFTENQTDAEHMSFTQMATIGQKITELNKNTENQLQLFDTTFLDLTEIKD